MRTRHIVAFVVLLGGSFASSGAVAWDQNPFAMYFHRSDKITLGEGDAKDSERRHPRHRPVAALMSATGEFRGTVIDCRARSNATARDRTGSQRRRSRRIGAALAGGGGGGGGGRRRRWRAVGGGGAGGG